MRALTTGIVCFTLFAAACGAPSRGDDDDDDDPTGDGGNPSGDGCSAEAKLIYVVDVNNQLSTYDPVSRTFNDKGALDCPAMQEATPFSMGIDRNANAYVLYNSGELFKVDTQTLACSPTSWQLGGPGFSLLVFGMGFSTNAAGGDTDTLYIAGGFGPTDPSSALNTLDVNTMTPTSVGTVQEWPELTGTGNAELWGFFPSETAPRIQQLDKTNGSALKTFPLNTLTGFPMSWAFAFFGGNFHVFLQRENETATTVFEVNGQTGMVSSMLPTNTRSIVGAGVSTCAPTVIL